MIVEYVVSWALLFIGASLIFKTALWIELVHFMNSVQKKELLFFILSGISLILGLLIVIPHNIWTLNPLVLVTFIGWSSLFKSVFFMFFPTKGIQIFQWFFKQERGFLIWGYRLIGSLYMILGVTILSYITT